MQCKGYPLYKEPVKKLKILIEYLVRAKMICEQLNILFEKNAFQSKEPPPPWECNKNKVSDLSGGLFCRLDGMMITLS